MAGQRVRLGVAAVAAAVSVAAATFSVPVHGVANPVVASLKSQQSYVLAGHPDDPVPHWAWIEQRPATDYLVFVSITRNEGTLACVSSEDAEHDTRASDDVVVNSEPNQFVSQLYPATGQPWVAPYRESFSTGPYRYEGPESPVGQPDRGERHPYGFPWTGQGSEGCARAQVATWHWFLDEAHLIDGSGTTMLIDDPWTDDDFQGRHCFKPDAMVRDQWPPRRLREVCAEVWANGESARVFFDLPDVHSHMSEDGTQSYSDLTFGPEAVKEVLEFVRQSRRAWGMPVLPEAGILGVGSYGDGNPCRTGASTVHKPILDLLRWEDLDIGEQAGPLACEDDPYGDGGDVEEISFTSMNPATLVAWNVVDPATGTRLGPLVKNFGWLLPNYVFDGCVAPNCSFWRRT